MFMVSVFILSVVEGVELRQMRQYKKGSALELVTLTQYVKIIPKPK